MTSSRTDDEDAIDSDRRDTYRAQIYEHKLNGYGYGHGHSTSLRLATHAHGGNEDRWVFRCCRTTLLPVWGQPLCAVGEKTEPREARIILVSIILFSPSFFPSSSLSSAGDTNDALSMLPEFTFSFPPTSPRRPPAPTRVDIILAHAPIFCDFSPAAHHDTKSKVRGIVRNTRELSPLYFRFPAYHNDHNRSNKNIICALPNLDAATASPRHRLRMIE